MDKRIGTRFAGLAAGSRLRGVMNKSCGEWSLWLESDEEVERWWYEPATFRLHHPATGQPCRITADFMVQFADGTIAMDDVKGGSPVQNDAALVRMAAAATIYPLFRWRQVVKQRVRDGGGFTIREL